MEKSLDDLKREGILFSNTMMTYNSFKLVAMKMVHASTEHLEKHCKNFMRIQLMFLDSDLSSKPFFPGYQSLFK